MDLEVIERIHVSMRDVFANSGTAYRIGLKAKRLIEESTDEIRKSLQIPSSHRIIFTSGGTESNNLFIKGLCFPDKKSAYLGLEHPSVVESLLFLMQFGNKPISLISFQKDGKLDFTSFEKLKEERVKFLFLSHVNNELGSIHDLQWVTTELMRKSPQTRLFIDGVQAVGKIRLDKVDWEGIVGYSISGHKIHGPKGIGLLIYDSKLALNPQMHGGNQQFGVRSGTPPLPLIMGLETAIKNSVSRTDRTQEHIKKLSKYLITGLRKLEEKNKNLEIRFNSNTGENKQSQSSGIINFSFPPVEGEVVLHHLEIKNIFVGLGSACSAQSKEPSKILVGIGLSEEEARCSLRISFSRQNSFEEIDQFLVAFEESYRTLYPTFIR